MNCPYPGGSFTPHSLVVALFPRASQDSRTKSGGRPAPQEPPTAHILPSDHARNDAYPNDPVGWADRWPSRGSRVRTYLTHPATMGWWAASWK